MPRDENAEIGRRWLAAWERGDEAEIDALYAGNFVYHMGFPGLEEGVAGEKQFVRMLHRGFPDLRIVVDDLVVDEHAVTVRWSMPATHTGEFPGLPPPSGERIVLNGIDILAIENGKIVARWDAVNRPAPLRGGPP
jgi:steroid delta-isomerase-like uncharacterized protein